MAWPIVVAVALAPSLAQAGQASEKAAAELLDAKLANDSPEDRAILKAVQGKDVVVVAGSMDHIEQVLAAANIRHTVIQPNQVARADLNADQVLMVNCPGTMPMAGVRRIERFVRAGGLLYSTDWALLNVIQKAFPRTIAHNGRSTADHVTAVHVHKKDDNLMSNMLLREGQEPQWWLEGGSYPIKILDPKRVRVLASSPEMGRRYGAAPVVVRFRWDDGEVIHVVSHFYRQIATRGPAVAAKDAIDDVEGLSVEQKAKFKKSASSGAKMGDVASSYAFQRMTANLVVGKKRRNKDLDKMYRWTPAKRLKVAGRALKKGDRLKVVQRKGKRIKVRDDRGNEAWVEQDDLVAR